MTKRSAAWLAAALALLLMLLVGGASVMLGIIQADPENYDQCGGGGDTTMVAADTGAPGAKVAGLTDKQRRNAATLIRVGTGMGITPKGLQVAVAMAYQESGILNLASRAVPESIRYPHDEVRDGDHDSVGIAQQRASWGSVRSRMRVDESMTRFYKALKAIPYESMSVPAAAQAVQRSAFPSAYAQWEDEAKAVVAANTGGAVTAEPVVNTDSGMQPAAKRAADFVRSKFGFKGTIGGYVNRNIAGTNQKSKHASGLAIDVMLPVGATSNAIADYFAGPGYDTFGVENVIHNRRIYNKARGWHDYRGDPHTSHVHVDFTGSEGAVGPAVPAVEDTGGDCPPTQDAASSGPVQYPLATKAAHDRHNYGGGGPHWAHGHTGTDYSVPCGTPVLAATDGNIVLDTTQGWAGRWLVKVQTGPKALTTWYAHMQSLSVSDGQPVKVGQQIGEVGALGNATGCHLHFEVHPKGGSIYEDGVNPSSWLAQNVGKEVDTGALPAKSTGDDVGGGFVIASFNVLGSAHTRGPGGKGPGEQRVRNVPRIFDAYGVEIAGLQEFTSGQARAFMAASSGWSMYHPPGDTENAIVWRTDSYKRVGQGSVSVPYFNNNRHMPWVVLADTEGNRAIFLNVHNPASNIRGMGDKSARRREAVRRERAAVARLHSTGLPVFWTGDMNARTDFYCAATAGGLVESAAGKRGSPCRKPAGTRIDWIMGTPEVSWSGWRLIRNATISRTTDHPLAIARATVH